VKAFIAHGTKSYLKESYCWHPLPNFAFTQSQLIMLYSRCFAGYYFATSAAIGSFLTARNAYIAKTPKETVGCTNPKSLDRYVVTYWAAVAGAIFGPIMLPAYVIQNANRGAMQSSLQSTLQSAKDIATYVPHSPAYIVV
jgi:hypothetical protein